MAVYHLCLKTVKRSSGRSAVAAAAYRAAALLHDDRTGLAHDYRRKPDVPACGIELPDGMDAPWALDRQSLWNAAEAAERRKDAQTAREFELALPGELSEERNIELARSFAGELAEEYGCAADWAIHGAPRGGDGRNAHAHILITVREVLPDGLGGKIRLVQEQARLKREGRPPSREQLRVIRERWAELANHALAEAGLDVRIDHRSHEAREAGIIPTRHVGVRAAAMRRKGMAIERAALDPREAELNAAHLLSHPEDVLRLVSEGKSAFGASDIRRAIALAAGSSGPLLDEVFKAAMNSPELVRIPSDGGAPRYAAKRTMDAEIAMQRSMRQLRERAGASDAAAAVEEARRDFEAEAGFELAGEQAEAARRICAPGGIACVSGAAGAGKSTALAVARAAWERSGSRVFGAALAGKAADGLRESSGIASRTLSAWAHRWEKGRDRLEAGDVLVIDEAGMLGTAQMAAAMAEVERRGAKLVLVGDSEQLQPIGAGAPFRAAAEAAGCASLSGIRRQRREWMRAATADFFHQRTEAALEAYAERGAIRWSDGAAGSLADLALAYSGSAAERPESPRIALAHRRADVAALNLLIREALLLRGLLPEGGAAFAAANGERVLAAGDRIAFLRNDGRLGVKNGSLGRVLSASESRIEAELDGGGRVGFDPREFRDFDLGYACTVHKSQGATVDEAFVLASRTMDRHLAYVGLSRHRDSALVFADRGSFADERDLAASMGRAGLKENVCDYEGFVERRGSDGQAPELAEAFLRFSGGAGAEPVAEPEALAAAGRAVAAALAVPPPAEEDVVVAKPEHVPSAARSAALAGLSERLEAQELRLAPDMAALRLRKVLKRCGAVDAGSPEMLAAWREACRAVADAGDGINETDGEGATAAHGLARSAGSPEWLRIGLEAGMDFTIADRGGATPLHDAVLNGNPAIADAALAAGADPNAGDANGRTPLHLAARHGRDAQILRLLSAGADPEMKDGFGRIPFDLASRPEGKPMAAGPALEGLRRPRLEGLRRLEKAVAGLGDAGGYRGPPRPERLESLTVCRDRIDLRRLALDESRDAAVTQSGAERSPRLFGRLRDAARLTVLPARLARSLRASMEGWARRRGFEFDRPEPRDGWSPPELRPPSDAEIMAARRAAERHRQVALDRRERENALQRKTDLVREKKRRAERELADLSILRQRRRRELEAEIRTAHEGLETLRFERKALPAAAPEPDGETLRLQSMRTSGERRRAAARQEVARMEKDGLFLRRRRDPARAHQWEYPPERSLLFVVASPAHVPDENGPARRWHHVAVWDPSSGPEGLKALRELHPDADMAPAPEARAEWPRDVPALDPDKADREFRNRGLAGHIGMVEGRAAEPGEFSEPEPEKPRDGGPSYDPF